MVEATLAAYSSGLAADGRRSESTTDGSTVATRASGRLASIDIIRGAVMVLMAIDHVRVYSGLPAGGPTAGIFFTRWVTHFCAPAFVFLAGTSAFLYGQRHSDLPRFLLTRGIWLVLLELTVIRVMWTFNFEFGQYMLAGVIWVIGWSMILMAGLVRLPVPVVGAIGLAIVAGHNILDSRFWQLAESLGDRPWAGLWKILYFSFFAGPITIGAGGPRLMVLYSIVPWVGVMAAGYAFGAVVAADSARRRRAVLRHRRSRRSRSSSFFAGSICMATQIRGACRARMAARRCRRCSRS